MTTPAACVPVCRGMSSSGGANFMISFANGSVLQAVAKSRLSFFALSSVVPGTSGIILARRSQSGRGISSARPMSRMSVLAPSVP